MDLLKESNDFAIPNAETTQAMRDAENSVNLSKAFHNVEELWESLNTEN